MQMPGRAVGKLLNPVQQRIIDRLIEACVTGKECRTSDVGPRRLPALGRGLHLLTKHALWQYAAECVERLPCVHPEAQRRFLAFWMASGWGLRYAAADDDAYCRATIKVRQRIASSEMLLNTDLLPHVNCSPTARERRGDEEAIEHGDAHGTEVCFGAAL
jgi:hypothetical protein